MARISTYQNDEIINDNDRLIGTDGGQIGTDGRVIAGTAGRTRNFTVGRLADYITSRGSDAVTRYNTELITASPPIDEELGFSTAYTVYAPSSNIMLVLPSVGDNGEAVPDGTWIRLTFIGNTGGMIFAGPPTPPASGRPAGDRFMAGIASDGSRASDPHLLIVQQTDEASFELIYVADLVEIDGVSAPVGWIIVN